MEQSFKTFDFPFVTWGALNPKPYLGWCGGDEFGDFYPMNHFGLKAS